MDNLLARFRTVQLLPNVGFECLENIDVSLRISATHSCPIARETHIGKVVATTKQQHADVDVLVLEWIGNVAHQEEIALGCIVHDENLSDSLPPLRASKGFLQTSVTRCAKQSSIVVEHDLHGH
jgi:hypothetical protein